MGQRIKNHNKNTPTFFLTFRNCQSKVEFESLYGTIN